MASTTIFTFISTIIPANIPITAVFTYTFPLVTITTTSDGSLATLTTPTIPTTITIPIPTSPVASSSSSSHIPPPITDSTSSSISLSESATVSTGVSEATTSPTAQTSDVISSTDPTTTPTFLPASNSRLENGAVAGIAVTSLVFGALLGAALIFFFLRRRRTAPENLEYTTVQHHDFESKGGVADSRVSTVSDNLQLGHFLPAPLSDKELSRELQALGYLIQQHVENNYHLQPIHENAGSITRYLDELGIGEKSPVPASKVAPLALGPQTRYAALQHVIATVVFGSLVPGTRNTISLLPPSVTEFSRELPPNGGRSGTSEVTEFALNRWRQLTAFLLNPERSERSGLTPKQEVSQQARQLASSLDKFLGLFVEPRNKEAQGSHLQSVIMECAKFGYVVFSQPAELDITLSSAEGLVTHPGLVAVRDEQGNKHNPPREVLEPTVASV